MRRACPTCPPWLLRCAHWAGYILMLGQPPTREQDCAECWGGVMRPLAVILLRGGWGRCSACQGPAMWRSEMEICLNFPDSDLVGARAAFDRQEEQLRQTHFVKQEQTE